jgi:hypothetical protein
MCMYINRYQFDTCMHIYKYARIYIHAYMCTYLYTSIFIRLFSFWNVCKLFLNNLQISCLHIFEELSNFISSGTARNNLQLFSETNLEALLTSGSIDVGFFYKIEKTWIGDLRFIKLPPHLAMNNISLNSYYEKVNFFWSIFIYFYFWRIYTYVCV